MFKNVIIFMVYFILFSSYAVAAENTYKSVKILVGGSLNFGEVNGYGLGDTVSCTYSGLLENKIIMSTAYTESDKSGRINIMFPDSLGYIRCLNLRFNVLSVNEAYIILIPSHQTNKRLSLRDYFITGH